MATRTKKAQAAEDKDLGFLAAIKALAKEKELDPEILFEAIEAALVAAYKKNFNNIPNVRVTMDRLTGSYHVYAIKSIVDEVEDPVQEISLAMAHKVSPDYQLGDTLEEEVTPADFGRVAAQSAKQMVVQRIREAERGNIVEAFSERVGDIVTGLVQQVDPKTVYVDLGKTEAIMPISEQIKGEDYYVNQRLKTVVLEVKANSKGPQVVVSRSHPNLLKRLFELEVPEIHDGVVEIKSVAREAGMRSKLAVYAREEHVDSIGSCVGHKGDRVQTIVNELGSEKIDIVEWNEDPAVYIANALSPAKVISVKAYPEEKMSRVVVPDGQLSLAIGKEGQNARLAAKLTGWKIDIKSRTQALDAPDWAEAPVRAAKESPAEAEDDDILAELGADSYDAPDADSQTEAVAGEDA